MVPAVVDRQGNEVPRNTGGFLVIRQPWPAMLRTIYGDDERYRQQYWEQVPHCYFTADGARQDEDGYFWIMGRVDDVINVAGHRLSTMEVESALVHHDLVAEAAVVGRPDELKGQVAVAFVVPRQAMAEAELAEQVMRQVNQDLGAVARPARVVAVAALPKTRSGKLLRRAMQALCEGREIGDLSTLEDAATLQALAEALKRA